MKIKSIAKLSLLASAMALTNSVSAENYYGGGINLIDYSIDEFGIDASLTTLTAKLGTKFNENLAFEGRIGFGVGDDTVEGVDVELSNYFGVYFKGGFSATEKVYPYAVLGYTRGKLKASGPGGSISSSDSDVSFGIGVDYSITNATALSFEYTNFYDKDGEELSGLNLFLSKTF